jgi:hypothetical protein
MLFSFTPTSFGCFHYTIFYLFCQSIRYLFWNVAIKDTESVAALFADDIIRYFRIGGDMKNLTAQKVYTRLRGSDEKIYDHGDLLADI